MAKYNLGQLSSHLTEIMQEKGVDVHHQKENKTPLTQALYLINLKAQNYIHAVITHPYVLESAGIKKGSDDFEGYKVLSEAIPLPEKLRPVNLLQMEPAASQ